MRTIIAGSRDIFDYTKLLIAIDKCGWRPSIVISGGARGVDKLGERWATENNIPLEIYRADWTKHGKSAGYIRNTLMAKQADALIALWDGISRGTKHMIDTAKQLKLHVYVS